MGGRGLIHKCCVVLMCICIPMLAGPWIFPIDVKVRRLSTTIRCTKILLWTKNRKIRGHSEFRVCVMRLCIQCVCIISTCVCVNVFACALLCIRWKKCVDAFDACACVTDMHFLVFLCVFCCFGFCVWP